MCLDEHALSMSSLLWGCFGGFSCIALSSGGLQIFLTSITGVFDQVQELPDLVCVLTQMVGEVGEVLQGKLTVDEESLLTVLLDVVVFSIC